MPGPKISPGLADVDVCYGAHKTGSEGVQSSMQKARWLYETAPLQRAGTLNLGRFNETAPISISDPYGVVDSDATDSPDLEVHGGFENLLAPPVQPLANGAQKSELPPTPPTMTNSDVVEQKRDDADLSPPPLFASGKRKSTDPQRHVQPGTPVKPQLSPPTPDPSPPRKLEKPSALPPMEQKERPQFLHPLVAGSPVEHLLKTVPSSRAESFMTAREAQSSTPGAGAAEVQLDENDTLPQHWLDSTKALQSATDGLGNITVEETPKIEENEKGIVTPRRRSRHESPPRFARQNSDWEKHISYVSGPDDLEISNSPVSPLAEDELNSARGLGLTGTDSHSPAAEVQPAPKTERQQIIERSSEELNNQVYSRIREENVKRHSVVSATPGAITVGIVVPSLDATPKLLKRQTKRLSLRDPDMSNGSKRNSRISSDSELRVNRTRPRPTDNKPALDESPILSANIRHVTSPARLGPDASDMTALTYASLQNSPSLKHRAAWPDDNNLRRKAAATSTHGERQASSGASEKIPDAPLVLPKQRTTDAHFESEPRRLRHVSHGERLSNNLSVRRTSLESSPPLLDRAPLSRQAQESGVRRVTTGDNRIMNNMAIKRASADTSRIAQQSETVASQVRGIIPSTTTDPGELSPSSKLRRFSRDDRLENNGSVRRTSLDQSQSPPQRDLSAGRQSLDRAVWPTSPTKSVDARFLQASTTPFSVSQTSDRTDVEICEASGVMLYPHNNDSLLVIQNGSRPASNDREIPNAPHFLDTTDGNISLPKPVFAAQVDPPTPELANSRPGHQVDSPLTNPRAAPTPPSFRFIPPTPNYELEKLEQAEGQSKTDDSGLSQPPRRLSLGQRARRYSDTLFPRLGSFRRPRDTRTEIEEREKHLSPQWKPQGFWDEFDSDSEEDFEPAGALPRGGDTSDIGIDEDVRKRGILPRAMSKRLPGFRGTGGFLVGNSLGIDRHGTNVRRHYVSTSTRILSKRQSEELLKNISTGAGGRASQDSIRRIQTARTFVVPFSGGMKAQWVGTQRFRARMKAIRLAKEEKEREKRRDQLRKSIGYRVYHDAK